MLRFSVLLFFFVGVNKQNLLFVIENTNYRIKYIITKYIYMDSAPILAHFYLFVYYHSFAVSVCVSCIQMRMHAKVFELARIYFKFECIWFFMFGFMRMMIEDASYS